jgi:hypothetical protein
MPNLIIQGIGLMIATTLVANGATVYIVGPKQADLDKIAKVYNEAAGKIPGKGRVHGLEGDVRQKVLSLFRKTTLYSEYLISPLVRSHPTCPRNWQTGKIYYHPLQQRRYRWNFVYIWCSRRTYCSIVCEKILRSRVSR